jgi:hypothetical protein
MHISRGSTQTAWTSPPAYQWVARTTRWTINISNQHRLKAASGTTPKIQVHNSASRSSTDFALGPASSAIYPSTAFARQGLLTAVDQHINARMGVEEISKSSELEAQAHNQAPSAIPSAKPKALFGAP